MNFDRLRFVAERAEIGEQREAVLAARCRRSPAAAKKFVSLIGSRSITGINYRYNDRARRMSSSAYRWPIAPRVAEAGRQPEKHGYATL